MELAVTIQMVRDGSKLEVYFLRQEQWCWMLQHSNPHSGLDGKTFLSLTAALEACGEWIVATQF